MRTHKFFEGQSVTSDVTSSEFVIDCGQDMRFLIQVEETVSITGNPRFYLEESFDVPGETNIWTSVMNPKTLNSFWTLGDLPIGIKDSYFMGEKMRVRIEANGASAGAVNVFMGYKTKV